ncbi:hypothetical protein [Phormidium pseudopriestleyi]|nr:hypothetical protein [Phormidium pseudopriestleyi]
MDQQQAVKLGDWVVPNPTIAAIAFESNPNFSQRFPSKQFCIQL